MKFVLGINRDKVKEKAWFIAARSSARRKISAGPYPDLYVCIGRMVYKI